MTLHVEKAELEHGEEPDGPGADDRNVGGNDFAHDLSPASPAS